MEDLPHLVLLFGKEWQECGVARHVHDFQVPLVDVQSLPASTTSLEIKKQIGH